VPQLLMLVLLSLLLLVLMLPKQLLHELVTCMGSLGTKANTSRPRRLLVLVVRSSHDEGTRGGSMVRGVHHGKLRTAARVRHHRRQRPDHVAVPVR